MKYFAMYIWIALSGLILGDSIDSKAERCGHAVHVDAEWIFSSLAWPILVFSVLTSSSNSVADSECKP